MLASFIRTDEFDDVLVTGEVMKNPHFVSDLFNVLGIRQLTLRDRLARALTTGRLFRHQERRPELTTSKFFVELEQIIHIRRFPSEHARRSRGFPHGIRLPRALIRFLILLARNASTITRAVSLDSRRTHPTPHAVRNASSRVPIASARAIARGNSIRAIKHNYDSLSPFASYAFASRDAPAPRAMIRTRPWFTSRSLGRSWGRGDVAVCRALPRVVRPNFADFAKRRSFYFPGVSPRDVDARRHTTTTTTTTTMAVRTRASPSASTMARASATTATTARRARARGRGSGRERARARATEGERVTEDAIGALRELADGTWNVGTYKSKRKVHLVNELGDIVGEEEALANISEQPGWDDAGKMRFCVMTVSDELGIDEDEVGKRLAQLFTLVPGLEGRMGDIRIADVTRLAARVPDVALAMIRLKDILPEANLERMVAARPSLLLADADELRRKISDLRACAPRLRWDKILSDFPELWDVRDFRENIEALKEKLSITDDETLTKVLGGQPGLLLSVQSRHDMILYDNGTLRQVQATVAGDTTSDGW